MDVLHTSVLARLEEQEIELPSWAFGNSGTRFKVFTQAGVPRDPFEKVADAAKVHELTGLAPRVALHIPWDKVDDYGALAAHAESLGVRLGTVNSNTFQDDEYKLGSLTHAEKTVRRRAVDHHIECIDVMDRTGSRDLKIWLAEGSNYPGQADLRGHPQRALDHRPLGLRQVTARAHRASDDVQRQVGSVECTRRTCSAQRRLRADLLGAVTQHAMTPQAVDGDARLGHGVGDRGQGRDRGEHVIGGHGRRD